MVRPDRANWLDEAIARTAPGRPPEPDFDAWRRRYPGAMETLAQRAQRKTHRSGPLPAAIAFGRELMRNPMIRLAAAAMLAVAVFILVRHLSGRETAPDDRTAIVADVARAELIRAEGLFRQNDVSGLLTLMETGRYGTKVKVAGYLERIGNASALSALEPLAAHWQGAPDTNPFQKAIDAIHQREQPAAEREPARAEPNAVSEHQPEGTPSSRSERSSPQSPAAPTEAIQKGMPTTEPDDVGRTKPNSISLRESPPLDGHSTVTGVVMDKSTHAPIRGAEVSFSAHEIAIADAQGQFHLVYARPDYEAHIYVVAPGYAVQRFMAPVAQRDIRDITVELAQGSTIAGRVTDQAGRPVPGAELSSICLPPQRRTVVTDADGRFEIDGFDPVVHGYAITIAHPDFPLTSATVPPARAGQTRYQDIVLQAGATILGQVTDGDGNPLEGVTVGNTGSRAMWDCITARTNTQGEYRLENVPVGELILWAADSNHGLYVERAVIQSDTAVKEMNIRLREPVPLHGGIVDETGAPVAGVQVIIHAYNGVSNLTDERYASDTNGRFVIPNAPAEGSITLACLREGICTEEHNFDLGLEEYVLRVRRAGRVYGMVLAETTGQPIPEFTVKMTASEIGSRVAGFRAQWLDEGYAFESPEGLFDTGIDRLPLGSMVRMTVQAPGHGSLTLDPVPIQPVSTDPNRTVFRLQPATVFAGRVVSRDGHPIEGATVLLFSDKSEPRREYWPRAETDVMGTYVLSDLEPEPYCLFVSAPGFAPRVHVMADLLEPANQLANLVLDIAATVTGRVIDENGEGIGGVRVGASASLGRAVDVLTRWPSLGPTTHTDNDGYYQLSEVPTGSVALSLCDSDGYELERQQVALEPGESKEVDFGGEGGYAVTGIVRIGGVPVENARISLRLEPARQSQRKTDPQGRFRIRSVTEGTYSLWVVWQPGFVEKPTQWPKEQLFHVRRTVHVDRDTELDVDLETGGGENQ